MARIRVEFGREHTDIEVADGCLVTGQRGLAPPAIQDVPAAVRQVLESPLEFPPLRQALTPDDHVGIVVAEEINRLPELLVPVLEHLLGAGVDLHKITVVCPPRGGESAQHAWQAELPQALQAMSIEEHAPAARNKLSYLATTKAGRRIYLNRTLVDADQLVVIGRIGYDTVLGYHGGIGDVFPAMSDEATRAEFALKVSQAPPNAKTRPAQQEADEVGWLLGMPFVVQVIEGHGDVITHVLAGAHGPVATRGRELLEKHWRVTVGRSAGLVVATIGGDPARQSFAQVTRALAAAARVVQPGGRIVVLSHASGDLGPSGDFIRGAENPAAALAQARQHKLPDAASVWELATAAQFAQLYLLSDIPRETAEELFVVPLDHAGQLQNLVNSADSCLILPDAHKTLALVEHK
jgi:nickel-dependent lactate racemase